MLSSVHDEREPLADVSMHALNTHASDKSHVTTVTFEFNIGTNSVRHGFQPNAMHAMQVACVKFSATRAT